MRRGVWGDAFAFRRRKRTVILFVGVSLNLFSLVRFLDWRYRLVARNDNVGPVWLHCSPCRGASN